MPSGAVPKLMASKQLKLMDGEKVVSYWTMSGNIAVIDYSRCDSLIPIETSPVDLHYKVHLLHQHEMKYRASMSKQNRVVGGKYLALVNGGANGTIVGRDMQIIYLNADGKRVRIGIAGDHHLIDNRLCCRFSVAKTI